MHPTAMPQGFDSGTHVMRRIEVRYAMDGACAAVDVICVRDVSCTGIAEEGEPRPGGWDFHPSTLCSRA